jgi:hypothetical protein
MSFTIVQFRIDFPEFADDAVYTDNIVAYWSRLAIKLIIESRWGDVYVDGINLFVAHNITLQAQDIKATSGGGVPGSVSGATSQKAVGQVSTSYDTTSSAVKNGGEWNATSYGRRYLKLSRLFGAGGLHV